MKTATDVGLQTWEADVTCGVWCQGGSVRWLKTDHPQYTDASDVWVRGDDAIAALESLRAELAELRKPDCRTCWHFDEHAFICTRATRIAICRTGEGYQRADPVRLYERGEE